MTLAVREDQDWWTADQAAVLKQAGIDSDVTQGELRGFLHLCQRTQLDPFARQIYLVGRWDGRAGRKVYSPQTGIDGYRLIAQRTCERVGQTLSYDDTLWCGPDGQWVDVWLADEPPKAAKVTVHRDAARFSAVARWEEYSVTRTDKKSGEVVMSGMWAKMPATMLAKCAEALALRKAFPNDMAGIYTAEEMQQADNPRPALARDEDYKPDPAHAQLVQEAYDTRKDGKARASAKRSDRSQPTEPIVDEWSTPPADPDASVPPAEWDPEVAARIEALDPALADDPTAVDP